MIFYFLVSKTDICSPCLNLIDLQDLPDAWSEIIINRLSNFNAVQLESTKISYENVIYSIVRDILLIDVTSRQLNLFSSLNDNVINWCNYECLQNFHYQEYLCADNGDNYLLLWFIVKKMKQLDLIQISIFILYFVTSYGYDL